MRRILALALLSLFVVSPQVVFAQTEFQGLVISTAFPSQVIPPGRPVSLTLEVSSAGLPPQVVELAVLEAPEGWQVNFLGDGRVVRALFLRADDSRSVTLKIEPPADAALGTYTILVGAKGTDAESQLDLSLTLGEVIPPRLSLDVELPTLKGTPTTTFAFRGTVRNDSAQDITINFEAQAPFGFEVVFKRGVGGQELASLPIKAGGSESINIEVRLPETTTAGEYPILVRTASEDISDEIQLMAVVSGKPDLSVTTPDGRLSGRIYSGAETPLKILVVNNGSAAAQNVRLEASTPARWSVVFQPETIADLAPGAEVEVTANIQPADKAIAGDYMLTLSATPENGSRESAEFRITVLTSTLWGVVGLVLIAAALGVVALAVGRFGRR